ncbi:signal recognition particle-docking protein FtsY [Streptococcus parauberis]|uniref:signal recognition particle-docking protein FtsY n=1 Tax=Streptococcus parauberis TaxID=1348 RepID=UPI000C146BBA|nr:signal recognition particle-docking protein FtsY [Streptococcus parauberis]PIA84002.1 Signal recognition particle receptor FtsY [Streptococcus parauberis]
MGLFDRLFGHKKEENQNLDTEQEKIEQVDEEQLEEVFPMEMSDEKPFEDESESENPLETDVPFYDGDNDDDFEVFDDEPDLSANLDNESVEIIEDSDDYEEKLDIQEIVETPELDTNQVNMAHKEEMTKSDDSPAMTENNQDEDLSSDDQNLALDDEPDMTRSESKSERVDSEMIASQSVQPSASSIQMMEEYYKRKAAFEKDIREGRIQPKADPVITEVEPVIVAELNESDQDKYDRSLAKTRTGFTARLNAFFANFRRVDEEFFEELEEMLILSDVGVTVATRLTDELRQEVKLENAKKPEDLRRVIVQKLVDIYEKDGVYNEAVNYQKGLTVMLFVGVNGVGKTTSIGKLAYKYKNEGKKVMLVAADTFRAGAVAQLAEWGRRVDVPVVMGPEKADPASVVFDGVERAVSENVDILLIDTAGRLQNKENLMAELEKMGRIIKRVIPDAPHETLLALDASTGQNALSQAKEFSKIMSLTGLILTKIDGSAKGGVVLAIRQELDIPVKFIGFGEKIDDIGQFDSEEFMKGLLGDII